MLTELRQKPRLWGSQWTSFSHWSQKSIKEMKQERDFILSMAVLERIEQFSDLRSVFRDNDNSFWFNREEIEAEGRKCALFSNLVKLWPR